MKPSEQNNSHKNGNVKKDVNDNGDDISSKLLIEIKSDSASSPCSSTRSSTVSTSRLESFVKSTAGRLFLLSLLVLDLAACTLLQRYTLIEDGSSFLPSAAVFVAESQKLVIAILVGVYWEHSGSWQSYSSSIRTELRQNRTETLLMAVPSIVYAIQNNLGYVALANLDPATYQVTIQLKIVTTAILMTMMMGTELSIQKWIAIVLLTAGVITVNMDKVFGSNSNENFEDTDINYVVGLSAVGAYCCASAFASVYFERLLKKPSSGGQTSLWMKNAQIYFFGSAVGALIMIGYDWKEVMANGVFQGFNTAVHVNVLLHSFGGVLVSLVMQYTDNIIKNFANGAAILLSTVGAVVFFHTEIGALFILGTLCVCVSAYLYKT